MATVTITIPDENYVKLEEIALIKGITINNLIEENSTKAIIEFDSYAKFQAISKQGNIEQGLMLLDKLDNLT